MSEPVTVDLLADRERLCVRRGTCWVCERTPVPVVVFNNPESLARPIGFCEGCVATMTALLREAQP